MTGYRLLAQAILVIFGFMWCREVFGRLRSDIAVLKESRDRGHKGLIIFFWVLTVGIIILMASFVWGMISAYF